MTADGPLPELPDRDEALNLGVLASMTLATGMAGLLAGYQYGVEAAGTALSPPSPPSWATGLLFVSLAAVMLLSGVEIVIEYRSGSADDGGDAPAGSEPEPQEATN